MRARRSWSLNVPLQWMCARADGIRQPSRNRFSLYSKPILSSDTGHRRAAPSIVRSTAGGNLRTLAASKLARILVERYAALGHPVKYLHRDNREGYKAGALAEGLKTAKGEFVAIFDADFVPPSAFLLKCIHHFTDPKVGMVQTRWTHINRNYSVLTEVEAILLDGHFVLEHSARSRSGVFFNFNGTAGMWRRSAIDEAGGWEHDTLTEDTDLSYRAQLKGWKFLYLQDVECPA